MILEQYLAFLVSSAILIIVPGPTNMVVVSVSMRHGFKKSAWAVMGAALSHMLFFCITSLGLAALLIASARIFSLIRWIGVIYLIWLGIGLWRTKAEHLRSGDVQTSVSNRSAFMLGFAANMTNPKALIFYSAFFPPFVNPMAPVEPQLLLMGATFVAIFMLIALLHGYVADRSRLYFNRPRHIMVQNRIAGSLLLGAGWLLAVTKRN